MKKMHLLSSAVVLGGTLWAAMPAMAASLVADYHFSNNLNDSLSGPAAVYPENTWYTNVNYVSETTLRGNTESALQVEWNNSDGNHTRGSGLSVNVAPTLTAANYNNFSVAMLVKFTDIRNSPYDRLYWSSATDSGVYLDGTGTGGTGASGLTFYNSSGEFPGGSSGSAALSIPTGAYTQLVLTRSGGVLTIYTGDGAGNPSALVARTTTGADGAFDVSASGLLNFFNDNTTGPDSGLGANIARLQIYQGALSASDVTNLNLVAPVPEPGMLATASLGICLAFRRRQLSANIR